MRLNILLGMLVALICLPLEERCRLPFLKIRLLFTHFLTFRENSRVVTPAEEVYEVVMASSVSFKVGNLD